jgi:hypothetical protein
LLPIKRRSIGRRLHNPGVGPLICLPAPDFDRGRSRIHNRVERFSWPRFLSIQIWLMVLFLIYVTIHELNMLFGDGELYRLFFRWRSSDAKLTRRRRIRLLTQLNRLTEANSIEAISERGSPRYNELVDILRVLASPPVSPQPRS